MKPYQLARPLGLLFLYFATLLFSLWLAYQLRFDFQPGVEYLVHFDLIAFALISLKLILLVFFGQFGSLLSYFSLPDLRKIFLAMLLSALTALAVWAWQGIRFAPPRAVILTDFVVSVAALCALRTGFRLLREGYFEKSGARASLRRRVGIIGAGSVGASLVLELGLRRSLRMEVVALFDDDPRKWQTSVHGVPVVGAPEIMPEFLKTQSLDEVIIALPGASAQRLREIIRVLTECAVRFETVPSLEQLVTGRVRVSQIRPVEIDDLLGRAPVDLAAENVRDLVHDKVVLVTGAGGSIGGELCRQIAALGPRQLLLVERSEFLLFQIEQELLGQTPDLSYVPLVADILDDARLSGIFARYRPEAVFHAAAHKHVPMMERQPGEALRNNVLGSRRLGRLAVQHGVERFVLISTDKAINPTSVMGATKRLAELYLQALHRHGGGRTKFIAVRFGNVLGSSGSVIPTFRRQIAAGGPVTVTHPDVTRYFMTVKEAVGLVLQSTTLGEGGEIFILDMGQPMKIADLARQLIELSGLQPDRDIEIQYTGLRPGEKLFEELNHRSENITGTSHPKILRLVGSPQNLEELEARLDDILPHVTTWDGPRLKQAIQGLVPEYRPDLNLS